jgi:hypothetical protein
MVEPGGGGLNPLQSAALDDFLPGHGHFGMPAKNIGLRQFGGDAFLAGVDNLGVWGRSGNLCDVLLFDRIAENYAGAWRQFGRATSRVTNRWRLRLYWHNIGFGGISCLWQGRANTDMSALPPTPIESLI